MWPQSVRKTSSPHLSRLVTIEIVEVCHDDRNRKCYGKNARDDAKCPDQLAPNSDRRDVTVANSCHGNDGPPKGSWDRSQLRLRFAHFGVISRRTEDDHCNEEEEEKHAQLVHTGLDCQTENSKTLAQDTLSWRTFIQFSNSYLLYLVYVAYYRTISDANWARKCNRKTVRLLYFY